MGYMTAVQAAKKWNISQRRVQILCAEGRIRGTFKLSEAWTIPDDKRKAKRLVLYQDLVQNKMRGSAS